MLVGGTRGYLHREDAGDAFSRSWHSVYLSEERYVDMSEDTSSLPVPLERALATTC